MTEYATLEPTRTNGTSEIDHVQAEITPEMIAAYQEKEQKRQQECGQRIQDILAEYGYTLVPETNIRLERSK